MSYDYSKLGTKVQGLIARFGKPATLHSNSLTGDQWSPADANSDISVTVVDLDTIEGANRTRVQTRQGEGTVAERTRKVLMSTASGAVPTSNDELTISGKRHEIKAVQALEPGPVTLLYEIELIR